MKTPFGESHDSVTLMDDCEQGWTADDLARRRKDDAVKVKLARRLRQKTTMTSPWTASQLKMGTAGSLANLLRQVK